MNKYSDIMVCIRCATYNHVNYIAQCLDGFVMQQTNFKYVAIVHDDCSTDGTTEILQEYAAKYPNIIVPIYETENQYSRGSLQKIMEDAVAQTNCRYIALCEGDDYWTDPLKLQKQVDFLESHPEYDMVCGRFKHLMHDSGEVFDSDLYDNLLPDNAIGMELKHEHFIHAALPHPCTVMFRQGTMYDNDLIGKLKYKFDYPAYWCYMTKHRAWLMNEKMSMYRKHGGSLTSSGIWDDKIYLAYLDILQYTPEDKVLKRACAPRYRAVAMRNAQDNNYNVCSYLSDMRTYISYFPSLRNVISLTTKIIRIKFAK